MTHHHHMDPDGGSPCFIQLAFPPNEGNVPNLIFPVSGPYGGTGPANVLINVVLTYANPVQPGFATGLLPPENPANQIYNRQFQNVTATLPEQIALLTAYLYDSTGTILLAQSMTIVVTILPT